LAIVEIRKQQDQIKVETAEIMREATILKAEGEFKYNGLATGR